MSQNFQFELNGQKVFTGMKMPDVPLTSFAPVSADKILTIDEIASRVKNPNLVKIEDEFANEVEWYDQGARSSCNPFAIGWAMAVMHWRKTGEKLRLSPEWLYSKINGGRDQGSMLDDGMVEARENGMSAYQEAFYEKFRQSDFNMEQKRWATQSAENHKFLECYYAPKTSFEQMVLSLFTCLAEGGCIVMAVHVGNNYMRSGRTAGFDNGMGNHAIAGTGLRLLKDNPQTIHDFEIVSPQSWGKNFAEGGFTGIRAKHLELPGKYHAMYCINAMNSTRESSDKVSELEE